MRMWRSLRDLICRNEPPTTAGPIEPTTDAEAPCGDDSANVRGDVPEAVFWDRWWKDRLARDGDLGNVQPCIRVPLVEYRGDFHDLVNSDDLLIAVMAEHGLRTVLCAGNGVSWEPQELAEAGFDVTALDLSPTASNIAQKAFDQRRVSHFAGPEVRPTRGHVEFVVGDLLDTTVCPGPFDVVIERRTVQRLREHERAAGLEALAGRLGEVGIFLSQCNDDYGSRLTLFHQSESWFRERGWTIWNGAPGSTLAGQVAWLIRSAA